MTTEIIIHDKKDNVGVVVIEKITPKQDCACWIMEDDSSTKIYNDSETNLSSEALTGETSLDSNKNKQEKTIININMKEIKTVLTLT